MAIELGLGIWRAQGGPVGGGAGTGSGGGSGGGPGPLPQTLTLSDFTRDQNVFDSGGAFGRNAALVPLSGQADAGAAIEARAVDAATGAALTGWADLADADAAGLWAGTISVPRAPGWLRMQTRLKANPAVTAATAKTCASGHVIGLMGQSELFRVMDNVASTRLYGGTILDTEQCQMVKGTPSPGGGGNPVTGYGVQRFFLTANPQSASAMTHAADVVQKNTTDKVMFIDMAISGTGREQLSNDADPLRRWQDLVAKLDRAGWADGVRPGVIVDMWTNFDGQTALQFVEAFKPFYTGKTADGSDYTLGDVIATTSFSSVNASVPIRHDHILFDLTGQGRGLFDPAETRIVLCHHRYDPATFNRRNWLFDTAAANALPEKVMWEQEILRREAFPALLADPDVAQIMVRGTEPLNYENGTLIPPSAWSDLIHPGQGNDGLALFARHMAHAGLYGANVVPQAVPEFDIVTHDPSGAFATFASSRGPVTTTRRLRGLADPSPLPGAHWTDVLGFEFNDMPVERAEIVDAAGNPAAAGAVRVHVPAAKAPADWARDRFWFGRGGGTGTLLNNDDPVAGGWLNYPVVAGTALGVQGLFDDSIASPGGGVALRPMPAETAIAPAAYRAAAVRIPANAYFQDPGAPGGGVTQLRYEARLATGDHNTALYLFGQGSRIYVEMNANLGLRIAFWAGGGISDAALRPITPHVRHDLVMEVDMVANTGRVWIDGVLALDHAISGTQNALQTTSQYAVMNAADRFSAHRGYEFEHFRMWKNALTGDPAVSPTAAPYKALLASSGAAALNADPWKRGTDI